MRPVSWCFGFGVGHLCWVLSALSVLMPTVWTKMPTWGFWCMPVCVAGPRPHDFHQQVQSVYSAHLMTSGSVACAWVRPVVKSSWRVSGGPSLPHNLAYGYLQHVFYIPSVTLIPQQSQANKRWSEVWILSENCGFKLLMTSLKAVPEVSEVTNTGFVSRSQKADLSELRNDFRYLVSWL